jgi:hypothetical protein
MSRLAWISAENVHRGPNRNCVALESVFFFCFCTALGLKMVMSVEAGDDRISVAILQANKII